MDIFDENVNDDISTFADSKILIDYDTYNDGNITKTASLYPHAEDKRREILDSFPIFGLIPNVKKFLPRNMRPGFVHNLPSVEWVWEGWDDEAIWDHIQIKTTTHEVVNKWKYLKALAGLRPKQKFLLYSKHHKQSQSDDSDYESEMEQEYHQFEEMINAISKSAWVKIFRMMKYGQGAPKGTVNRHEHLVEQLDPENKFFRRKKKGMKRKRNYVNLNEQRDLVKDLDGWV